MRVPHREKTAEKEMCVKKKIEKKEQNVAAFEKNN